MTMTGQTLRERSDLIYEDIRFVFGTADLKFAGPDNTVSLARGG
jgi:hypothetical protein